jgi:hypothetical protein
MNQRQDLLSKIHGTLDKNIRSADARVEVKHLGDGVIELQGYARDFLIKKNVENLLMGMGEISGVQNKITVDPIQMHMYRRKLS